MIRPLVTQRTFTDYPPHAGLRAGAGETGN